MPCPSPISDFNNRIDSPDLEQTEAANELLHLNSASSVEVVAQEVVLDDQSGFFDNIGHHEDALMITAVTAVTPPDAAFSRWFGLLLEDADYTAGITSSIIPDMNSDGRMLSMTPSTLHSDNGIVEGRRNWVELQLDSDSRYCSSPEVTRDQLSRRQPWRGSEPSKLLPHEESLFGNFVRHVSTWVCASDLIGVAYADHCLSRSTSSTQHDVSQSLSHIWRLVYVYHTPSTQRLTVFKLHDAGLSKYYISATNYDLLRYKSDNVNILRAFYY